MILEQYYLDCLSHASYLVGDAGSGRAVVVDPRRDVAQYVRDADAHGLHIERVIETHVHADFVSGHLELAAQTGAVVLVGASEALDPARPTIVYCASGARSAVAASVLRAHGFADVSDVLGGYQAWKARAA